jgi:hypothetical protein
MRNIAQIGERYKRIFAPRLKGQNQCIFAHMNDRDELRQAHRALIRQIMAEAGAKTATALARKMGVHPSLLNKVMRDSPKQKHVLSAPTLQLLEKFRGTLPSSEGRLDIDPQIIRDLLNAPENRRFLGLWIGMEHSTKMAALDIMEAVSRIAAKKVS